MKFIVFFALHFILLCSCVIAVPVDSAKKEVPIPTLIKFIDENAFTTQQVNYHSLDTTLDSIEVINPVYGRHANHLANLGSAASFQEFIFNKNIFTDGGFHTYDLYLFDRTKIRYFKTNKAFTQLNYHLSGGKEQQITVALSENITKDWNAGLDFNRLGSTGFLKNGTTLHTNVNLYSWLHTENNRYNLLAFAFWNTIDNKVNGGLHSDSIFDNNLLSNLALQGLQVNLTDAENHFKNHVFSLSQYYDIRYHSGEMDSGSETGKDSNTTKKIIFNPDARISHSISLEARSFTYQDNTPGTYYKDTFRTPSSLDSLHYYDLRNKISWSSILNRKNQQDSLHAFYYSLFMEHQWFRYDQVTYPDLQVVNAFMENVSLGASVSNKENVTSFHWLVAGNYFLAGENKTDYLGEIFLHSPIGGFGNIEISGKMLLKSPDFIYRRYFSNHFVWENTFEKNSVKNISVQFLFPRYYVTIGVELTTMSNYIYNDSTAHPEQAQTETSVMKYYLNKNFRYGKIHFNNSIIGQKVNNDEVLHLPSFIFTHSLFYESFFYKNALLLQSGFDLHFNSFYYADAFMQATGMFYWQNEKKTGGFPLIDFFINFRIKTARMFLSLKTLENLFLEKVIT